MASTATVGLAVVGVASILAPAYGCGRRSTGFRLLQRFALHRFSSMWDWKSLRNKAAADETGAVGMEIRAQRRGMSDTKSSTTSSCLSVAQSPSPRRIFSIELA